MGFQILFGDKTIVNVGDSILQTEWEGLKPDVLILPIGGMGNNAWTMDLSEALETVKLISPRKIIPCHYNVPFFWIKNMAPANGQLFKQEVKKLGIERSIMQYGDEISI